MLEPRARKKLIGCLRRGSGEWVGKSCREIAALLSQESGKAVSAETVRYYIRQAKKEGHDICMRPGGNVKGSKLNRAPGYPAWQGAVFNELLVLTGLSASRLYDLLQPTFNAEGEFMSRAACYKLVAPCLKRITAPQVGSTSRGDGDKLRLHAICLERAPEKLYWIVLAAYEQRTGYLRFKLLQAKISPDSEASVSGGCIIRVENNNETVECSVPPALVQTFVDEIRKTIWPLLVEEVVVTRFVANELPSADIKFSFDPQRGERYIKLSSANVLTAEKMLEKLSCFQNLHNRFHAHSKISSRRAAVLKEIKMARADLYLNEFGGNKNLKLGLRTIKALYENQTLAVAKLRTVKCKSLAVRAILKKARD